MNFSPIYRAFSVCSAMVIKLIRGLIGLFYNSSTHTLTLFGALGVAGFGIAIFLVLISIIRNFLRF